MGGELGEGIAVGRLVGLGGQAWAEWRAGCGEGVLTGTYRYPISGELREEEGEEWVDSGLGAVEFTAYCRNGGQANGTSD